MSQRIRFKGPRRSWSRPSTEQREDSTFDDSTGADIDLPLEAAEAVRVVDTRGLDDSWMASSFDLATGLEVTEFEDTVPSDLLDDQ